MHRQHRIPRTRRGQMPVVCSTAIPAGTPGIRIVRFVAKVESDHCRVIRIMCRQVCPVIDPGALRIAARVPEPARLSRIPRLRTMVIEDHPQPQRARIPHDLVQDLQRIQPLQIRVDRPPLPLL